MPGGSASTKDGAKYPEIRALSNLLLIYEESCALGDQVENLFKIVDPKPVCLSFLMI